MECGKYVIYSRKSRFTGKGESIENQILLCRQYIAAHFGEDAAREASVYEDEGFSGGNLDRPNFRRMMEDAQTGEFAAIVVYRLDRISRNIGDFAMLIEDLGRRSIDFISIREQFDTSSPMGRAMMYIASVFSQLERETIAERIRDNLHELARTGRWLGGVTPFGYRSESVGEVNADGKTRKSCRLVPVPEEITLVKRVFMRFSETGSLTETERELDHTGEKTRSGGRFTRFALRGILTNPVYMRADGEAYRYFAGDSELCAPESAFDGAHGMMVFNRTLQKNGAARLNPKEEWIVAVGSHEGAVPGETWVRVQKMLDRKKKRKRISGASLLSGILYCACCGERMRPKMSGRIRSDGEAGFIYLCTGKEKTHGKSCSVRNADGNALDGMVLSEIGRLERDDSLWKKRLTQYRKQLAAQTDDGAEVLRRRMEENRERIRNLTRMLGSCESPAAEKYIMEQIGEYHELGEKIGRELEEMERLFPYFADTEVRFGEFTEAVSCLSMEEKRETVRCFTERIVWDGEKAEMYLRTFCEDSK